MESEGRLQESGTSERPTDQEVKDSQQSELDQAREDRNARLGIGNHTEDGPKPESPVGGNLPPTLDSQGNRSE